MLPFYFVTIFLTFFPWVLQYAMADAKALATSVIRSTRYLIGGAAVVFIAFTLVKTKLPHYTLPAFPLLALLLAKALLDFPEGATFRQAHRPYRCGHGTGRSGRDTVRREDSSFQQISLDKRDAT